MEIFEAISNRRSIRKYEDREIEDEKINKILEAGRLAPSAGNRQEWKFIVVKDKETRKKFIEAANNQEFVGNASIILVACAMEPDYIMPCGQYAYTVDLSISMSFMMLEATDQGLGSCWLGAFDEDKVKELLNIPEDIRVVAVTTLGYPDEEPIQRPRKTMKQVVCYETYENNSF